MTAQPRYLLRLDLVAAALRRHVDQSPPALLEQLVARLLLMGSDVRVDECGRQLAAMQAVRLVDHQRLQRREHERRRLALENRGQLEAQALAASRWADDEKRFAAQSSENSVHLPVAKARHAKQLQSGVERTRLVRKLATTVQKASQRQRPSFDRAPCQRHLKIQMASRVASFA